MSYLIRFKGFRAGEVYKKPYTIKEWPDSEREGAVNEWNDKFSIDPEFYEFLYLEENKEKK